MSAIGVGQAVILGMVEGVTEFLPVSSTGHLKMAEGLMNIPVKDDAVVAFTAVIQVGAIAAVFVYFFRDIMRFVSAWLRGLLHKEERDSHDYKFTWWVIWSTIPIVVVGLAAKPLIDGPLGSLWVVAFSLIGGSVVMWCAEQMARFKRGEPDVTFKDAMLVGTSQILALLAAQRIGEVLASLVSFSNPDTIVLGGSIASLHDDLLADIRAAVYRRALPLATRTVAIETTLLGRRAGIEGARRRAVHHLLSPQGLARMLH